MKFLVVGLGSMGKRRVRNLIALGFKDDVIGFDLRADRRAEAKSKYDIQISDNFEAALEQYKPGALLISTPPNFHMHYAHIAAKNNISCFIEASVVDADKILELIELIKTKAIVMAPSCTMRFYPAPMKIKQLIDEHKIGDILNYNYHTGQYLPDWHPWEKIEDFYVSNPDTGGCREIVPFELTWLNDIFGDSTALACVRRKLTDMPADIEDIYHCLLQYPNNVIGNLTVEVISRPRATRQMRILGTTGEIIYTADDNIVKYINTDMDEWQEFSFAQGTVEAGYINPEEPYINEVKAFVQAVASVKSGGQSTYPNSLEDDYKILQTLYTLEDISEGKNELSR
ncbi:MAG: Gfo/Idh/MocA family oxidoreductase [OCS116 cluster bacterium]|nr:Gfo/Idh/MocA family oxidoreductase [OCS116 cluster bacterium]